jgi:hypothetical protein
VTVREPVTTATLLTWRRTGLTVALAGALSLVAGLALVSSAEDAIEVIGAVASVVGAVGVVIGSSFLRRAWSDPLVAADPQAGRLRSWGGAVWAVWCAALLLRLVARPLPDGLDWLGVVGWVLGAAAVAAWLWLLVLVARWRPRRV